MIKGSLIKVLIKYQEPIIKYLLKRKGITLLDPEGDLIWSNAIPVEKEDAKFNRFIERYRNLWPDGYKGIPEIVKDRATRILREGYSKSQIIKITRYWLKNNGTPYHGKADYFLYKHDNSSKVWKSSFKETFEYLASKRDQQEDDDFYGHEFTY